MNDVARGPAGAGVQLPRFIDPAVTLDRRRDGSVIVRSTTELQPWRTPISAWLEHWAQSTPEQRLMVEPSGEGETAITYAEARRRVLALAEYLLQFDLGPERPLVVMADSGIDHALLRLAAYYLGVPIAPIAPAYALQATEFSKLSHSFRLLTPGLVVVERGDAYRHALAEALDPSVPTRVLSGAGAGQQLLDVRSIRGTAEGEARVGTISRSVTDDTPATYLFTSGSTGLPKAVVLTHGNFAAASQMQRQVTRCIADEPPVMIDWLPWNHVAGVSNFHLVLYNGGTLHIDAGKPTPALIDKSIDLLRRVSPTVYFNVPMGYDTLIPYLEEDSALRENFFRRVKFLWYAAAAMQPSTWAKLEGLADRATGRSIAILSGLGMTETGPIALFGNPLASGVGVMGSPVPGLELKLVPRGEQYEAWYRGPNVTPGYLRNPEATASAFDGEGFFNSGDLVSFVDEKRPELGLRFEGRASEDFKLSSGTRVAAGTLRIAALECFRPFVSDVVIVGEGRDDVRMLLFPDWNALGALAEASSDKEVIIRSPHVRDMLLERLQALAVQGTGSSNRIVAAMISEPPAAMAGELTEKGTVNGRAVQRNRAADIDALFAGAGDPRILVAGAHSAH